MTEQVAGLSTIDFALEGVTPLIQHRPLLADPTHPLSARMKQLTSVRQKSDDDHAAIKRLELLCGLYWSETAKCPYVPGIAIERTLYEAAKLRKLGKAFGRAAVEVPDFEIPLIVPRKSWASAEELVDDEEHIHTCGARVQNKLIMRSRPIFPRWKCHVTVQFDPEAIDARDIVSAMQTAGKRIGLLDWRPKFGRFNAEVKA